MNITSQKITSDQGGGRSTSSVGGLEGGGGKDQQKLRLDEQSNPVTVLEKIARQHSAMIVVVEQ